MKPVYQAKFEPGPVFFGVSLVDAICIKSKWSANFNQVFPFGYKDLPNTHSTDKEMFQENWKGDKSTTYEQFMRFHYPKWSKVA